MPFGVFNSPLTFCKPTSLWDSDPVTITLSYKTLFCWCGNCLTWLPGSNSCLVCKSAPRMHLTITFLSTETAPWQKMYSKDDFLFFAFKTKACKSSGSWEQQHMLIIRITIREFNLTEGRGRGPPRGSTKALKNSRWNKPSRFGYSWVMGETWLWKTVLVLLQILKKCCVGRTRNADKQNQALGNLPSRAARRSLTKGRQSYLQQLSQGWAWKPGRPLASAPCEPCTALLPSAGGCGASHFSPALIPYWISGFQAWVCNQRSKSLNLSLW